ncbi:dynamin family protein [Vibrio renipiscarius]|uniref:dynamin family protein n=1 Tax=Vibrio renipiscarius TaxID=1461322 RepID=UPI00069C4F7A|nr:dynamin family protein [Vibrio renipiscarius]
MVDFISASGCEDFICNVSVKYSKHLDSINANLIDELSNLADVFKNDAIHAEEENRLLRIGIVGQIKRGKSSFLNSLLFDGEDILPKAATPMTAALTKISYSENPRASVEFYTRKEWDKVLEQAKQVAEVNAVYQGELVEYQNSQNTGVRGKGVRPPRPPKHSDEATSCFELYQMMQRSNICVEEYLDQTHVIDNVSSNERLVADLEPYVGANGAFTPIVKSTSLELCLEGLKDIEVVDTPGMNDPIISRGRRTQEFLGQCDVIFLLSYCGQFLDMHDMALLAQNIPNKGIEEIVLIGSLFDSALMDEYQNYASIQEALPALTRKLNDAATGNVESVCRQDAQNNGGQSHLMRTLQNALPPIFVSARCYDLARKANQLNEEESHTLNRLNTMYEGFTFTPDILHALANFKKVDAKLDAIRENKVAILESRLDNLLAGVQRELVQKLDAMRQDISHKQRNLERGDLVKMEADRKALTQKIEAGTARIKMVFDKQHVQVEKFLNTAQMNIAQDALAVKRVSSQSGAREEAYTTSHQVSDSDWWNPFSWGSTRTVASTHYRTVNYTYANVQDAVLKLEEFVQHVSGTLYTASQNAINVNQFREEIKQAVKGLFDFSDADFDPEMILLPLSNTVERITISTISLDLDHHIHLIRQQFSVNEVEGDEIEQLRVEQARVVTLLLTDIKAEMDRCSTEMLGKLSHEEQKFIPDLTCGLHGNVEQLKRDLEDKEKAFGEYAKILKIIEDDKQRLLIA